MSACVAAVAWAEPPQAAVWRSLAGSEAVYATVRDARGVRGCQGVRGGLHADVRADVQRALAAAMAEAASVGATPSRARVTALCDGRSVEAGAAFDAQHAALLAEKGDAVAVVLPGETRSAAAAWRRARVLLRRRGVAAPETRLRGRVFAVRGIELNAGDLRAWEQWAPPAHEERR